MAGAEMVPSDPHHVLWDLALSLTCCVTLGQSLISPGFIFLGEKGLIIMRFPDTVPGLAGAKANKDTPLFRDLGSRPSCVTPTSHPTCPGRGRHVCKAGRTQADPLFVSLAIYTLPASKRDRRQLVIRCCENRPGKSKARRQEEEEASRPATSTDIVSVVHRTLFAWGPRKLGAKFMIPELDSPDNDPFKRKSALTSCSRDTTVFGLVFIPGIKF